MTAALTAAGCASGDGQGGAPTGDTLPDAVAAGSVTVSADPALTNALTDSQSRLAVDNSSLKVNLRFVADPAGLARAGQADLVVGAVSALNDLQSGGVVDTPVPFALDELQIVVAPGNPLGITSAADLARPALRVALDPANSAAARLLQAVSASPTKVAVPTSAAAITAVHDGAADATVVYASEAADGNADLTVSVAGELDAGRVFAIALVKGSKQRKPAEGYIDQLLYGVGSQAVQGRGFRLL